MPVRWGARCGGCGVAGCPSGTTVTSGESFRREEIYQQRVMEGAVAAALEWRVRPAGRDLALAGRIKGARNRRARVAGSPCPGPGLGPAAAAASRSASQAGDGRRGSKQRWAGRARRG